MARYPSLAPALESIPDETVIDGEVIALDAHGRPSFNLLQNYGSSKTPLSLVAFDVLVLAGREVMDETLERRRHLLETRILPKLDEPLRYSPELKADLRTLIRSVKEQGLEGLVANGGAAGTSRACAPAPGKR